MIDLQTLVLIIGLVTIVPIWWIIKGDDDES